MPGLVRTDRDRLWAALLAVANLSAARRVDEQIASPERLSRSGVEGVLAVAGWSAAQLHGWTSGQPSEVQLLAHADVVARRKGIRLIRSRRGIDGFWRWTDGLPVTTPVRTMWDCAHLSSGSHASVAQLADLAVLLDRTRQLEVDHLIAAVDEPAMFGLPSRPPRPLVATVELLRPGFSHSATEATARHIIAEECRALELRAQPRPYQVKDENGKTLAEADVAVLSLRLDLEVDGPHHDAPSQQAADRRRDAKVGQIDWIVIRYAVRSIEQDWNAFRRTVRADLRRVMALRRQERPTG